MRKFITALAARRAGNEAYRTTLRELGNLTRRDLDDIGISAADIGGIAREVGRAAYVARLNEKKEDVVSPAGDAAFAS